MRLGKLPGFRLKTAGPLGSRFRSCGIEDFRQAAAHVRDLPYGRNSDRSDWGLVLAEGRGTCSTKHALLAALAREHGADVELRLGIYLMDAKNTPAAAKALDAGRLDALPEAHCYLAHKDERVDVTGIESSGVEGFLHEEVIGPEQIGAYKVEAHKKFLRKWAARRGLDPEHVWRVREECIAALANTAA